MAPCAQTLAPQPGALGQHLGCSSSWPGCGLVLTPRVVAVRGHKTLGSVFRPAGLAVDRAASALGPITLRRLRKRLKWPQAVSWEALLRRRGLGLLRGQAAVAQAPSCVHTSPPATSLLCHLHTCSHVAPWHLSSCEPGWRPGSSSPRPRPRGATALPPGAGSVPSLTLAFVTPAPPATEQGGRPSRQTRMDTALSPESPVDIRVHAWCWALLGVDQVK